MKENSNWLLETRKALKMTQQELADSLGVAKNYIYLIESGRKPLTESVRHAVERLDSYPHTNLTQDVSIEGRIKAAELRAEIAEQRLKQVSDTLDAILQLTAQLKEVVR